MPCECAFDLKYALALISGTRRKTGFTDDFLVSKGAAAGSTIAMTESGYMTEAAWCKIAPKIAFFGLRSLPVVCDKPEWWALKVIDGFGPHTSSLEAMEIYSSHKILLLKEEGDTSHVCQVCCTKLGHGCLLNLIHQLHACAEHSITTILCAHMSSLCPLIDVRCCACHRPMTNMLRKKIRRQCGTASHFCDHPHR